MKKQECISKNPMFCLKRAQKQQKKLKKNKESLLSIVNEQEYIDWLDRRIVRKKLDIMPTYHYVQNQGKLMMQSRENGQKHQFAQIYDNFEISTNCNFFWKIGFIQTEGRI